MTTEEIKEAGAYFQWCVYAVPMCLFGFWTLMYLIVAIGWNRAACDVTYRTIDFLRRPADDDARVRLVEALEFVLIRHRDMTASLPTKNEVVRLVKKYSDSTRG
jgi:hypothetical protein